MMTANATDLTWAQTPDCMYIIDAHERRSTSLNHPLWQYLGYQLAEVECPDAAVPQSYLHHEDAVLVDDLFAHLLDMTADAEYRRHLRFRTKKGKWLTFCLRIVPHNIDAKQFLGILTDITPEKGSFHRIKKKLSSIRQTNKQMDMLLMELSHDIRVPLQTIHLLAESLETDHMKQSTLEQVQNISMTAKHLHTTLNTILAGRRDAEGAAAITAGRTNIRSLLQQVAFEVQVRLHRRPVTFSYQVDPLVPKELQIDSGRLYQLFINLLMNAIKHTTKGSIHLDCEWHAKKSRLTIIVEDSGTGIAKEDLARVNDLFFSDQVDKDSYGVGLQICQNIISSLGGTGVTTSELGVGTKVEISFPAEVFTEVVTLKDAEDLKPLGEFQILAIDDDPFCLSLLSLFATSLGGECVAIDNLHDANNRDFSSFDLIFVDNKLPRACGQRLVKHIRDNGYRGPVYIISGENPVGKVIDECTGWLRKPLTYDQFYHLIDQTMGQGGVYAQAGDAI